MSSCRVNHICPASVDVRFPDREQYSPLILLQYTVYWNDKQLYLQFTKCYSVSYPCQINSCNSVSFPPFALLEATPFRLHHSSNSGCNSILPPLFLLLPRNSATTLFFLLYRNPDPTPVAPLVTSPAQLWTDPYHWLLISSLSRLYYHLISF